MDSSIARKSDAVLYTQAGPEIGVASTKAFTTQLVVLALLGLYLAQQKKSISEDVLGKLAASLSHLPTLLEEVLKTEKEIERWKKERKSLISIRDKRIEKEKESNYLKIS